MEHSRPEHDPVDVVAARIAAAAGIFSLGLYVVNASHFWGLLLIGFGVAYLLYAALKRQGMLGLLAGTILFVIIAALSVPRFDFYKKTHQTTVGNGGGPESIPASLPAQPQRPSLKQLTVPKQKPREAIEPKNESTTDSPLDMYFTNPEIVEWNVKNNSSASISNILCWFGLFDLDQPFITPSPLVPAAPFNPLPITVQKIDFINPDIPVGAVLLPTNLINRIKTGDRIVGLAGFSYPNGKEKVYWLFFTFREGGWYAPTTRESIKRTGVPVSALVQDTSGTLDSLVPKKDRIEIKKVDR